MASVGIVLLTVEDSLRFSVSQAKKKERLVFDHRPTNREAEVVALERGHLGGIEEVPGIQLLITEKVVCRAMKQVGTRLHGEIHNATGGSPELRRVRVGLYFEFLNRVDRRLDHLRLIRIERCVVGIVIEAIEQVIVVCGALSTRAEPPGPAPHAVIGSRCRTSLAGGGSVPSESRDSCK